MISYDHPNYKQIQDHCANRFAHEFNSIPLELLEKAYPELYEHVVVPRDYYEGDDDPEPLYPMWGTVFEASSSFVSDKIDELIEELADLSIYVMQGLDELNSCLFIAGAGYDFYHEHWIPMMLLFGWIPENLLEVSDDTDGR
jgi:hypothetical protein